MTKKHLVTLKDAEREHLCGILSRGKHNAQKYKRAKALLLADEGKTDAEIASQVGMHRRGIENLRIRFVEQSFEQALEGNPKGHRSALIQGEDEARLVALVCGPKPEGRNRWTLRLLADRYVTLNNEHVSEETIRQALKKTNLSLGGK
jgi:transposase